MINTECIKFRIGKPSDYIRLTEITFAAKYFWNYPKEYYEIWQSEMTITQDYISKNQVYLATCNEEIIGFSSVVEVSNASYENEIYVKKGFWLDHLFIDPQYLTNGIGTRLIEITREHCLEKGITELFIFAEPLAKGFYEKIGSKLMYLTASTIPGRMLPVYCLTL